MDTAKKLVRGLKDVSPMFNAGVIVQEEVWPRYAPALQVLGVSSPDYDGDSLFLNTFFASQIASQGRPCSLVSVLSRCSHSPRAEISETFGEHLRRHCLYWDELKDLVSMQPASFEGHRLKDRDIFLDFEYKHLIHFDQIIRLLDKWVLFLKPTAESLTEGYKMMKAGLLLNPQVSFFITLEGKAENRKEEMIFERFSELAFRHLNIDLGWLGWVDPSDSGRHFSAALRADQLSFQGWNERPLLEKFSLANWIELRERQEQKTTAQEDS